MVDVRAREESCHASERVDAHGDVRHLRQETDLLVDTVVRQPASVYDPRPGG